ncbi:CerR family C-terminal domain-containing protein [Gilvimarinus algae]|uniref:CerR family C-terminal domain-containing protein n=1 Tax=Gilvimarinus algae TaxID=3058037 RepID=A0ABT8TJ46_9GAMM|nr:CerR family C-terminal domain-containing protein [Gilvimarinus sp. SDUM040014]MDO3383514.1 CerR family C-terminal domain-containing protein [Gilvimarinus sp. SDUM040014]
MTQKKANARPALAQGDSTEAKLLDAGMALFGELGFKATTTRMIADRAGANIGSIAYYFGNKRGLYLAIAEHIGQHLKEKLGIAQLFAEAPPADELSPVLALELLNQLANKMIDLFACDREAEKWLMVIMREQVNPTEAFEHLYKNAFLQVHSTLSFLISRLMKRSAEEDEVLMETHFLVGRIVFLLVGKTPLLRRLGQTGGYSEETVVLAKGVMARHLRQLVN